MTTPLVRVSTTGLAGRRRKQPRLGQADQRGERTAARPHREQPERTRAVRACDDEQRHLDHEPERVVHERLIYAYHQSARIEPDSPALHGVREVGATLRGLDWPFVGYQAPVSVSTGERHFGPAFRAQVERNFALMTAALNDGAGREVDVVRSGTTFEAELFIDPALADEHLNERGRHRLAGLIAAAVRAARSG